MSGTPTRRLGDDWYETVEEIDAAAEAITDEDITGRLGRLLTHLADTSTSGVQPQTAAGVLGATPPTDDAVEVEDLTETLQTARRQLRAVHSELMTARTRYDDMKRAAGLAQRRLTEARTQLAEAAPGAAAYLDAVNARGQEILDQAHTTANEIIADAKARADGILGRARFHAACRPTSMADEG